MSRNSFSCLWPRAIIELRFDNDRDSVATMLKLVRSSFAKSAVRLDQAVQVDITHMQQSLGSPADIAGQLQIFARDHGLPTPAIGVASDPLIASYAAKFLIANGTQVIAPWEARSRLHNERISRIGFSLPAVAQKMEHAGIHTGKQLAGLSERVLQHYFGDNSLRLWRACRGVGGASAPEVSCFYNAVSCRVVLPPRTSNKRSIVSHARRLSSAFSSALLRIQRPAQQIHLLIRDEFYPDGVESGMILQNNNPRLPELFHSVKETLEAAWSGTAVTHLELVAQNLPAPGGQLELFATA